MGTVDAAEVLGVLRDYESRASQARAGKRLDETEAAGWRGIGFRLGARRLVAPMSDIQEVLGLPPLSRVPGAKPWLLGIANVRGQLLPVMDLRLFLGGGGTRVRRSARVLQVVRDDVMAGFLVDEVYGLKTFSGDPGDSASDGVEAWLAPCLTGGFRDSGGEGEWSVFSVQSVIDQPGFMQAAA